jgi:Ca-activated chloride channel family protein
MHRFPAVIDVVRLGCRAIADRLLRCAHRRTSFPMTPRSSGTVGASQSMTGTYIVCLECGLHIPYDWATMRIARLAPVRRGLGGSPNGRGVARGERLSSRAVFPMLFLIGLAGGANPPELTPSGGQDPGSFRIAVNVDLVVLHATVRDRSGRFVSGLRQEDFAVYEDGVRQSIRLFRNEDIPVTVGLVVDKSGSMRPKLGEVIAAARAFVRASNPDDEMFVVNFNEKVILGLPAAVPFTGSADALERAISVAPPTGQTALYDAIGEALARLQKGSRDKKVLIVISDGGDNASGRTLAEVLKTAQLSDAIVYTIGIFDQGDPDRNPRVLRSLARTTGGEAFFPAHRNELVEICEGIARDIRHQYTVGYLYNGAERPGAFRAIRVVAGRAADKLVVRTRTGYFAAGGPRAGVK